MIPGDKIFYLIITSMGQWRFPAGEPPVTAGKLPTEIPVREPASTTIPRD
jgi:hypothetical protein